MALATESAATEAEIERRWRTVTEQAGKEFEKAQYALSQKLTAARAAAAARQQEHAAKLHASFMAEVAEAQWAWRGAASAIERDHEPVDRKTREQLEQAVWLADSVLEVAQNQVRAEDKKVKEQIKTHSDAVDGVEQQADKLLLKYGVQRPLRARAVSRESHCLPPMIRNLTWLAASMPARRT